jgi:kynureninase
MKSPVQDLTEAFARDLDQSDPLAEFRDRFYRPDGVVYLDGNSLGLLSRDSEAAVLLVLDQWKGLAVEGWLDADRPWYTLAESLAAETAFLVGAAPDQIAVTNSTTVNLHQLLATLFAPTGARAVLLADALAFPSDLYAIQSHLRLRGLSAETHLRIVRSRDGLSLDEADIIDAMTDEVALAVLPSVLYTSGQLLDIGRISEEARRRGVLLGLDLSHSIGALPHALDAWGVDFAFWCNYKYLNAGPGSIGGLYLNRRHFGKSPGMAGWFGSRKSTQFDMSAVFDPAPDAGMLQIGTPSVLSMAPLMGSLPMVREAGIDRIRRKSLDLTRYLIALADTLLNDVGVTVATPREDWRRGGHVALSHPEATRICRALKTARVVPDYRPPNIVRFAPIALYSTFHDCYRAVTELRRILLTEEHLKYPRERGLVA